MTSIGPVFGGKQLKDSHVATLLGCFDVVTLDGKSALPSGRKERALIACLLLSPGYRRTRRSLQALLWSDRAPPQAAASLRQALSVLRRRLNINSELVCANSEFVWLTAGIIRCDVDSDFHVTSSTSQHLVGVELLDGMDVRDAAFDDWLRDIRTNFRSRNQHSRLTTGFVDPTLNFNQAMVEQTRAQIQLVLCSISDRHRAKANFFYKSLTSTLDEIGILAITVVRGHDDQPMFVENCSERDIYIRVEALSDVDDLVLLISIMRTVDRHLNHQFVVSVPSGSENTSFSELIMRTCTALIIDLDEASGKLDPKDSARIDTARVLRGLLNVGSVDFETMENDIESAIIRNPSGINHALRGAVTLLKYGERLRGDTKNLEDMIGQDMRAAHQLAASNGLVHALAGHALGFYSRNFSSALDLTRSAVTLSPHNALCWALYATSLIYANRPQEALAAALNALRIGHASFARPFLEAVCCMASAISGNFDLAIRHGEFSRMYSPNFRPTLNFLMTSYAMTGQQEKANELGRKSIELDPTFSISTILSPDYPVVGDQAKKVLLLGAQSVDSIPHY